MLIRSNNGEGVSNDTMVTYSLPVDDPVDPVLAQHSLGWTILRVLKSLG